MKSKPKLIKNQEGEEYTNSDYIIPIVSYDKDEPRIKIWDASGKFFWYKNIGFNRDIRDN